MADGGGGLVHTPEPAPGWELTPDLAKMLLEGARSGLFRSAVAQARGLPIEVLDTWLRMGLSPGAVEPFRSFSRFYVAAEAGAQLPYVSAWQAAAQVDWRAAQAWLAARWPEQWGPKPTQARAAAELQPTDADAAAEEEMVAALLRSRPPVLMRLLEKEGLLSPRAPEPQEIQTKPPGGKRPASG